MKINPNVVVVIFVSLILCFPTSAWGRSMVTCEVVDAQTKDPIEGAAVYIYWEKSHWGPPGLGPKTEIVEIAEDQTNNAGQFTIPKYSTWFRRYQMAIYKKGYVCWSNEDIFPSLEKRTDFKLKNGVIIKLEHNQVRFSNLRTEQPSLEDVFLSLTGREMRD